MKTLDEVIKKCQGYVDDVAKGWDKQDCSLPYDDMMDAFHYLKEYRDKHEEMLQMEEALGYCEMADNRPLTWQELRQMEGKPVWVEEKYSFNKEWHGSWEVICTVWDNEWDDDPYLSMTNEEYRHKDDMGERWQAYRKERND